MRSQWLLLGVGAALLTGAAFGFWSLGSVKNAVARDLTAAREYEDSLPGMRRLSERLHLALAGAEAPKLRAQYFARRLYDVITQIQRGNSGIAYKALTALEQDLQALIRNPEATGELPHMREAVSGVQTLLVGELPSSPFYRLKQRLEDQAVLLAGSDKQAAIQARLAALNTRLNEAESLLSQRALEEMGLCLEAVRQGGNNVERDLQAAGLLAEIAKTFNAQLRSIRVKERELREKLSIQLAPAPSVEYAVTTSTVMVAATSSNQEATSTGNGWAKLVLSVAPQQITVGQAARLKLTGITHAGAKIDLTPTAEFSLPHGGAKLLDADLTPTESGHLLVVAAIEDESGATSTSLALVVGQNSPVTGIEIVPVSDPIISSGGSIKLTVKALRTDGSVVPVTSLVKWDTDPKLGAVRSGTFTATLQAIGPVIIKAEYAENGVVKNHQIVVTIR